MTNPTPTNTSLREIEDELYKTLDLRIHDVKERIAYRQVIDKLLTAKTTEAELQLVTELLDTFPPTDYEGRDFLGGFNDARRQIADFLKRKQLKRPTKETE